jgi:hypothetical protein
MLVDAVGRACMDINESPTEPVLRGTHTLQAVCSRRSISKQASKQATVVITTHE